MTERLDQQLSDSDTLRESEMSLLEHLGELRTRLVFSALAIVVGAVFAYSIIGELLSVFSRPFELAFSESQMIGTGPAEAFILKLKFAFFAGIVLASPVVFFQIWLFVSPGLHEHERKLALPFLFFTTALFVSGITFCYFAVLPFAYEFFAEQYRSIGIAPTIRISEHLTFLVRVLLVFGIVFEMPVLAFFLGRIGIITDRMLIGWFRHAVVVIFIVAAILTPPDVVTQFLMALPLLALYGVSILLVRYTAPKESSKSSVKNTNT
ncbi:MAG: twin-arginine translocase subunit TatC [Bdellovibrionales bacterium]|nr:twin-arginine translocase subunit TatC [Bdellovibrionales bacterium]